MILQTAEHLLTGRVIPEVADPKSLYDVLREDERCPVNFSLIQEVMQKEARAKLPGSLVRDLGFADLNWEYRGDDPNINPNMPYLFLGYRESTSAQGLERVSAALGTIVVSRMVFGVDDTVIVDRVRVAGVMQDSREQKRVVGLTYSGIRRELIVLDVSVSERELPEGYKDPWGVIYLPTSFDNTEPYAGIETETMRAETEERHRLVVRSYSPTQRLHDVRLASFNLRKLGFNFDTGLWNASLSREDTVRQRDWKVKVPNHLSRRFALLG